MSDEIVPASATDDAKWAGGRRRNIILDPFLDVAADIEKTGFVGLERTYRSGVGEAVVIVRYDALGGDAGQRGGGVIRVISDRVGRRPFRTPYIDRLLVGIP